MVWPWTYDPTLSSWVAGLIGLHHQTQMNMSSFENFSYSWVWWCTPLIPARERQRRIQMNLWVWDQPGQHPGQPGLSSEIPAQKNNSVAWINYFIYWVVDMLVGSEEPFFFWPDYLHELRDWSLTQFPCPALRIPRTWSLWPETEIKSHDTHTHTHTHTHTFPPYLWPIGIVNVCWGCGV